MITLQESDGDVALSLIDPEVVPHLTGVNHVIIGGQVRFPDLYLEPERSWRTWKS